MKILVQKEGNSWTAFLLEAQCQQTGTSKDEAVAKCICNCGAKVGIEVIRLSDDDRNEWDRETSLDALLKQKKSKTWKKIMLGTHVNGAGLIRALQGKQCLIDDYAKRMIEQPTFRVAAQKQKIDLIRTSVMDLGFEFGTSLREIFGRAIDEFGWKLCPAEVGPQLRRQYVNQPLNEKITVATTPIRIPYVNERLFCLENTGQTMRLSERYGNLGTCLEPEEVLVFAA